jgi:membrane fusion protein, copper/silver efflux system
MKRNVVLVVLLITVLATGAYLVIREFTHRPDQLSESEYYTCPMHPVVRSDRPGACPVCGMALVKKSSDSRQDTTVSAGLAEVSMSSLQRVMANVSTVAVARSTITRTIDAVGVVSFSEKLQATVAARFRGRINKVYVNFTGRRVAQDEPLFDLYSPDLIVAQREYLIARERSSDSSSMTGDINRQMLTSSEERLRIHFGLTPGQIREVASSRAVREYLTFHSPVGGTVLEKNVQEGMYVDEGMVLYKLADLSRVWIILDIYEQDLRFIREGAEVEVRSDVYPGEYFLAKVLFIDPVVNGETRTIRVRLEAPNLHGKLKPNMYIRGSIQLPSRKVLVVPRAAVISTGRQEIVWVEVGQNRFEPRGVTAGITTASETEILEGLNEGERVAATGGYLIGSENALSLRPGTSSVSAPVFPTPPKLGPRHSPKLKPVDVRIDVDYGYEPEEVHVKAGIPVRLNFIRHEDSDCSREVVFKTLNIRRDLPKGKSVTVEFTPSSRGTIGFECGMGMLQGKIIVD